MAKPNKSKSNKYTLVVATLSHLEDIYKMSRKAFLQGSEGHLDIVPEKMKNMIHHLVSSSHQFAVLAMSNGRPKAVMLGHVDSHAYCRGLVASDVCLYVSPILRGTSCCADLVECYVGWCSRIPNLVGSTLSISQLNATSPYMDALYRKHGYSKGAVAYTLMR